MRHLRPQNTTEDSDIDITPMLDVVFIMLIFFIVTASFVKESGFGLNNPDQINNSEPPEIIPIVVAINNQDRIEVADREVDVRAVKPTVLRLKAERPKAAVVVKVAEQARVETVMGVIDGIRQSGTLNPTVSLDEKN